MLSFVSPLTTVLLSLYLPDLGHIFILVYCLGGFRYVIRLEIMQHLFNSLFA